MRLRSPFPKPVRFHGADAAAYRDRANGRDLIAFRLFATLIVFGLSSRTLVDWNVTPQDVEATALHRLAAIGGMAGLFAASFLRSFRRFFHMALGAGAFFVVGAVAVGNAITPTYYPNVTTGSWMMIFLMGAFSFRPRLAALVVLSVAVLPQAAMFLANKPLLALSTLIPLAGLTVTLTLAMSYALEQHWRRGFQKDLDLAASHEEQRRTLRKLAEAYETLRETQARLFKVEQTAALGRLVANVAHRINTPIGNVVAVASHTDESIRRLSDAMQNGGLRRADLTASIASIAEGNTIILDNAKRTAGLIDTFKRLVADAGESPARQEADELLSTLRPTLQAMIPPGVTLTVEAPPGLVIMAQWHVMETVVVELVRNAVTHAFAEGRAGTLSVRACAIPGGAVEFQVTDDGRGIPDRHLGHVFDPFYTDGNIGDHCGLGLSIVHNAVVGPLRGQIAIDSREGQGTTVTILLPAAAPDEADRAAVPASA